MQITDMELEPAARALYEFSTAGKGAKNWTDDDWLPKTRQTWFDGARAAVGAAPQPVLPVCPSCSADEFTCGGCGTRLEADVAPQPVVDREALRQLVAYCREREVYRGRDNEIGADTAYGDVADRLDAVLALINGTAK
jgi:hypothetical protein